WAVPGVILVLGGIYGWGLEPADDDENPPHHHAPGEALGAGDAPAAELEAASEPEPAMAQTEEVAGD
ncbi:MAG: hypothetical protein ABW279_15905, partial [Acidimicrobiales bacterium]